MMSKFKIVLIIVIVGLVFYFAPNFFLGEKIKVIQVTRGPIVEAIYATGNVESKEMIQVGARNPARILELLVDEGNEVQADQLLARFEDSDLLHKLSELKFKEDLSRKEFERNSNLFKKKAISQEQYDQKEAEWKMSQEATKNVEAQIKYLNLYAPKAGQIIKRDGEVGQLISANQVVFWMAGSKTRRITAEVDEEDVAKVQVDQRVLIQADAFPDKVFEGKINQITPKGDPVTRSYRVRVSFENAPELLIGMTTELNIIVRESQESLLLAIPGANSNTLCKIENGRMRPVEVQIGIKGEDQVEVLSGLSEGDQVVADKKFECIEGKRVRVQ